MTAAATAHVRDDFGSFIPAHRRQRLRASLADAQMRGQLGEQLDGDVHRAIARRWSRGRGARGALPPMPKGEFGKEISRNLVKLRHAFDTAAATPAQREILERAIADIVRLAGDVGTTPAGRAWRPRRRGGARGTVKHPAAGRRAVLLDQAVAEALPGWRDGMELPARAVPAVCEAASRLCRAEGFSRPSESRIRNWLKRRAKQPAPGLAGGGR